MMAHSLNREEEMDRWRDGLTLIIIYSLSIKYFSASEIQEAENVRHWPTSRWMNDSDSTNMIKIWFVTLTHHSQSENMELWTDNQQVLHKKMYSKVILDACWTKWDFKFVHKWKTCGPTQPDTEPALVRANLTQNFITCKIMNTHLCFETSLTHKHRHTNVQFSSKASPKHLRTHASNVFKTANPRQIYIMYH